MLPVTELVTNVAKTVKNWGHLYVRARDMSTM